MASRRPAARALVTLSLVAALAATGGASYTVQAGDTLWDIAREFGVSVPSLARANGIGDTSYVRTGDTLTIPGGSSAAATAGGTTHTVQPGETLLDISIASGVLMRDIAAANGLSSYDRIYAGQSLQLPSGAGAVSSPAPTSPAPATGDVGAMIDRIAPQYGLSPRFVKAVAYMESGWNNTVVSVDGAVGIMQVLPETGEFVSTYLVGRPLDLNDAEDNVTAGTAFLAYLMRLTGDDARRALAGYYQGLRSVSENGYYDDTRSYIATVMALRDRF